MRIFAAAALAKLENTILPEFPSEGHSGCACPDLDQITAEMLAKNELIGKAIDQETLVVIKEAVASGNPELAARSLKAVDDILAGASFDMRLYLTRALAEIRDRRATPALAALARDSVFSIRAEAVRAIGACGGPVALEHLTKALKDEHPSVQIWAAEGLANMGEGGIAVIALKEAAYKIENEKKLKKNWSLWREGDKQKELVRASRLLERIESSMGTEDSFLEGVGDKMGEAGK